MLGLLAYGFVFHHGFLNSCLSVGIGWWALRFAWKETTQGLLAAVALLPLAAVAHLLPVLPPTALFGYSVVVRRMPATRRIWLLLAGVAGLAAMRLVLSVTYRTVSGSPIHALMIGADQLFLYGAPYRMLAWILAAIWLVELAPLLKRRAEVGPEVCSLLHLVALCLVSTVLLLPGSSCHSTGTASGSLRTGSRFSRQCSPVRF